MCRLTLVFDSTSCSTTTFMLIFQNTGLPSDTVESLLYLNTTAKSSREEECSHVAILTLRQRIL